MTRINSKSLLSHLAALLVGGAIFGSAFALADGDYATQTVVGPELLLPYDGVLMVDGEGFTGARDIKFELYLDQTATSTSVWSETLSVQVYRGNFSVVLGTDTSLTDTLLDAEQLYVGMTIIEKDDAGTILNALTGRQAIEAAPYAAWAAKASDFNVTGSLTVGAGAFITGAESDGVSAALKVVTSSDTTKSLLLDGDTIESVGGELGLQLQSRNTVTLSNTFEVGGTDLLLGTDNTSNRGDGGRALSHLSGDTLYVNYANDFSGGTHIDSDLTLDGIFKPSYVTWDGSNVGSGGAAIANENNTHKALMFVGNNISSSTRRIEMYDNVTVDDNLTLTNGTLDAATLTATTLSASGTINRPTSCPGSPVADLHSSVSQQRICMYARASSQRYEDQAQGCWSTYGAPLCRHGQMVSAINAGLVPTKFYYLAERTANNYGVTTNATSISNFDGESNDAVEDGGYCCLVLRGK